MNLPVITVGFRPLLILATAAAHAGKNSKICCLKACNQIDNGKLERTKTVLQQVAHGLFSGWPAHDDDMGSGLQHILLKSTSDGAP
jgi:hypothetical protein